MMQQKFSYVIVTTIRLFGQFRRREIHFIIKFVINKTQDLL